jgi:hypothetical protein
MTMSGWRLRRLGWIGLCLLVLVGPVLILAFFRATYAVSHGLLLGGWLLLAGVGLAELSAPSAVLKWRRWMMTGGPPRELALGRAFDQVLATSDIGAPIAARNVRIVGLVILSIGTLLIALTYWSLRAAGLA